MNKWKCMIVDDEPVAIRILRQHLDKLSTYEVVRTDTNATDAFEYLGRNSVDLLLLDIEMPELNGLDLFRSLKNPPGLILVTAHRDYAVEGFEVNAIDYLMKPVSFSRLLEALQRFEHQYADPEPVPNLNQKRYLFVTVDRIKRKIDLDDIIYIEGLKDYVQIRTNSETIITRETMSDMERQLPEDTFLRIHRSFIINMDKIRTVSYDEITLEKETLPVGRTYRTGVMQRLHIE
ncbi:MAG TPA: LytTR family DNA-binding domain-containing protein [Balneolales bacterium]|nr:LytTR family DNA-binding domain-containing protein [Balneolales bacterium]